MDGDATEKRAVKRRRIERSPTAGKYKITSRKAHGLNSLSDPEIGPQDALQQSIKDCSDPSKTSSFSFPTAYTTSPTPQISFTGRTNFIPLWSRIHDLDISYNKYLCITGTSGSGKTHLLSAIIHLMRKFENHIVLYISDCQAMVQHPSGYASYVHDELLHAIKSSRRGDEILSKVSLPEKTSPGREYSFQLTYYANRLSKVGFMMYIAVNQEDDLDPQPGDSSEVEKERHSAWRLLRPMASRHVMITTGTENSRLVSSESQRYPEFGEMRFTMAGGCDNVSIIAGFQLLLVIFC